MTLDARIQQASAELNIYRPDGFLSLSVFDREDESSRSGGSMAALERRQAERKKELMRAQTLPKTSASQARKAMIEKLEKDGGG